MGSPLLRFAVGLPHPAQSALMVPLNFEIILSPYSQLEDFHLPLEQLFSKSCNPCDLSLPPNPTKIKDTGSLTNRCTAKDKTSSMFQFRAALVFVLFFCLERGGGGYVLEYSKLTLFDHHLAYLLWSLWQVNEPILLQPWSYFSCAAVTALVLYLTDTPSTYSQLCQMFHSISQCCAQTEYVLRLIYNQWLTRS